MKKSLLVFLVLLVGCVSAESKVTISNQAARLDREVNFINSKAVTQQQMEDFIRAERRVWWALNFSINDAPLPADMQTTAPVTSVK